MSQQQSWAQGKQDPEISTVTCPNYFSFQIHVVLLNLLACTRNKSKRHSPKLLPGSGLQCLTQMLADPACTRQRKESRSCHLLPKIPIPASPRLAILPCQPRTRHRSISDGATAREGQAQRSHSPCGHGALRNASAPHGWEIAIAWSPGAAVS